MEDQAAEPQLPTIVIAMQANGQLNVSGPITNKILCIGMLEMAKQVVLDFQPEPVLSPIIEG